MGFSFTRWAGLLVFGLGIVFGAAPNAQVGWLEHGDMTLRQQDFVHYVMLIGGSWLLATSKAWRDI